MGVARFSFRFERLLHIKALREEQLQTELATIQRRVDEARTRAHTLSLQLKTREEQLRAIQQSTQIPIDQMLALAAFIERLRSELAEHAQQVAALVDEKGRKRAKLIEAMKERKALESLRERQFQDFRIDLQRREQKETDEMALRTIR